MKLSVILAASVVASVSAYPVAWRKRVVDPKLVPEFGFENGVNPTGTGDCDGAPGTNTKIPCSCPPDRDVFLQALNTNIDAGRVVNNTAAFPFSFPTDDSLQSEIDRITGVLITLQNINGSGKGCPAVSTTLGPKRQQLQAALDAGQTALIPEGPVATTSVVGGGLPAPAPTAVAAASTVTVTVTATKTQTVEGQCSSSAAIVEASQISSSAGPKATPIDSAVISTSAPIITSAATKTSAAAASETSSATSSGVIDEAEIARLAPDLGFTAGQNPTGTGDCDGAIPGGPKVPCSCPPARDSYVAALTANIKAGVVLKNPTVTVEFPLDDSKASERKRLGAAIVTLQSLKGPGQGCPIVSTTLSAQLAAL